MLRIAPAKTFDLSIVLRGLAATAVVWWHIHGYKAPGIKALNIPGRVGVWIFFGLSGYVIAHGFFHGRYGFDAASISKFAIRRAFRILPLFVLISVIACATFLLQGRPVPIGIWDIPSQIFMLQWWHDYALIGVFWTLGVELQFYLIAPLMIWLVIKAGDRWLQLGLLAWFALWLWPWLSMKVLGTSIDDRTTLGNLQHFLVGILICRASISARSSKYLVAWKPWWPLGVGAAFLLIASWQYHGNQQRFFELRGALLTDLSIAFFLLAHCSFERLAIPTGRVTRALLLLGVLSYGLYAWHGYLLVSFPWFEKQFAATFFVSLALAYLSFVIVERPAIAVSHRSST